MANLRDGLCGLCFVRVCVCNKLFTSRDDDHIFSSFTFLALSLEEDLDRPRLLQSIGFPKNQSLRSIGRFPSVNASLPKFSSGSD